MTNHWQPCPGIQLHRVDRMQRLLRKARELLVLIVLHRFRVQVFPIGAAADRSDRWDEGTPIEDRGCSGRYTTKPQALNEA